MAAGLLLRTLGLRFVQALLVLLAVAAVSFLLFRFVGDPVAQMVGQDTPPAERERLRDSLGLTDPLPVQFAHFVTRAVQGDFGLSLRAGRPVLDLIGERLPASVELALAALALALLFGVPMGLFAAMKPRHALARLFDTLSLAGVSVPTFVIGVLLIALFSVQLEWLPAFGRGDVVDLGVWSTGFLTGSGWRALILPAMTLAIFQLALVQRLVRAEMEPVLRSDFIRSARARGLSETRIALRHALPNAMVPLLTVSGLQLGSTIAFAMVTEAIFQWPGFGLLLLQSLQSADIPVLAASLLLIALFFVVINLAVDLSYLAADPRLREERNHAGQR